MPSHFSRARLKCSFFLEERGCYGNCTNSHFPPNPNPKLIEDLTLLDEVSHRTAGVSRLEMCIQCGTCGGSCPSAADMDHTPRMLFAMIRAGMRQSALMSNTPWICVSCYHCVVRCPQNVHIADVMYTLKGMAIESKLYRELNCARFLTDLC